MIPLLRSPPFPWVKPEVAVVSRPWPDAPPLAPERLRTLLRAIGDARIGGDFWKKQSGPAGETAVTTDDETKLLIAIASGKEPDSATMALAERLIGRVAYRDPFTDKKIAPEAAITILADWRRTIDANRRIAAISGISWWKKQAIERFLWAGDAGFPVAAETAAEALAAATSGQAIGVWPSRTPEGLVEAAAAAGVPITAIEDGFIRSVGLGSDLHVPRSIVVDGQGIYYDPNRPSDLETLLATSDFSSVLVERAAKLRATIVERGISKYASGPAAAPPIARTKRTVLVAGQVEDDMSVRAGGGGIGGNLALLRRAREMEPGSILLFRPHPDCDAGHRVGGIPDKQALALADDVVRAESMASLLARVDAVHVLTSQTGFEALLRGVETIVHGRPFYAGWGLTTDLAGKIERRGRTLSIDELAAGALILYPRYWDPVTDLPCQPEVLLDRFAAQNRQKRSLLVRARQWQGRIARLFNRVTD